MGSSAGATLVTAEQLKSYVSDLRAKSNIYKQARIELNDLKAEYGILSRTLEILNDQQSSLATTMVTQHHSNQLTTETNAYSVATGDW